MPRRCTDGLVPVGEILTGLKLPRLHYLFLCVACRGGMGEWADLRAINTEIVELDAPVGVRWVGWQGIGIPLFRRRFVSQLRGA